MDKKQASAVLAKHQSGDGKIQSDEHMHALLNAHNALGMAVQSETIAAINEHLATGDGPQGKTRVAAYKGGWRFIIHTAASQDTADTYDNED